MVAEMSVVPSHSPMERYRRDQEHGFEHDPAQAVVIDYLQGIYFSLKQQSDSQPGFISRLIGRKQDPLKGLYLWGGVGRGKTYLVDTFCESLDFVPRRRIHFHHFMRDIHDQLKELPKSPNPMPIIANRLAAKYKVLILDEFFVDDIADAMLLVGLLPPLFESGLVLVTTSNIHPDELYKNGLQRLHFIKAIDEIKANTHVVELVEGDDYRLKMLKRSGTYHVTDSKQAGDRVLQQQFMELVPEHERLCEPLIINNREIQARGLSPDIVWFDFHAICETPRSSSDYVEIAQSYHTVLIGAVPIMSEAKEDVAKRFMHLIDALYDHGVKLILTAETEANRLYEGKLIATAFARTVSRLHEMGSQDYLSQPHRV
ncbi:MAG: cell division protein ZapE [Gammaproteobacteria bacterium]|nr:cell division protein ZapE [Gammaproteobacteria bacterium]